jgi:hypothetical protein
LGGLAPINHVLAIYAHKVRCPVQTIRVVGL